MKKVLALLIVIVMAAGMLAGCAGQPAQPAPDATPGPDGTDPGESNGQPTGGDDDFGGTLTIGTSGDMPSFNAMVLNSVAEMQILHLTYPTLMMLNEAGDKVPYVIEEPEFSDDGLTVTVTLLDGLYWSDGVPFTSADVDFTYRILYEEQLQWQYDFLENVTWATPDEKTIVFTLQEPYPNFFYAVGYWQVIVPAHIWSEVDDIRTFQNDEVPPVGMGPFLITEWQRGSYYILEAVDNWPLAEAGRPYLDRVIFRPYPDTNTMLLALRSGDIDITAVGLNATAASEFANDPAFRISGNMSLGYHHFHFNLRHPLLSDNAIRTALAYGVDRDTIIQFGFEGDAYPMTSIVSPVYEKYQIGNDFPPYDPAAGVAVLEQAGYVMGEDGIFTTADGQRLSFELMIDVALTEHDRVARILVENAKQVGIEFVIDAVERSIQMERLYNTHEYQIGLNRWGIIDDVESTYNALFHSSSVGALNWMNYLNPEVDEILERMRRTSDEDEIMDYMNRFQRHIADDKPTIPLLVPRFSYVNSTQFEGFRMFPSDLRGQVDPSSLMNVRYVG